MQCTTDLIPYIKILAYRNCVVVCTSEDLHYKVRELLQSKNRDEIFELPLVYGQTIHYVPNDNYTEDVLTSLNYECQYLFGRDILSLTGLAGFENSLSFDENGSTPTKAVYIAKDNNKIIGVAGAAESSTDGIWEIGIDVMEEYRNARLARKWWQVDVTIYRYGLIHLEPFLMGVQYTMI